MVKVSVSFFAIRNMEDVIVEVSRVPCIGEAIAFNGQPYDVHRVLHHTELDDAVASITVR